jgi:hypothetical protein
MTHSLSHRLRWTIALMIIVLISFLGVCSNNKDSFSMFCHVANAFSIYQFVSLSRKTFHKKNMMKQLILSSQINENDDDDDDNITTGNMLDDNNTYFMSNLARTGMKDLEELQVGDIIVAKIDSPSLRIWKGSGYEITKIYFKGVNPNTGLVEEVTLKYFSDTTAIRPSNYKQYLEVYNPRDHREYGPVIVSPEEIGLVTVRSEIMEAMLLAIPGFFWVFVAAAFASSYNEQYGGNFWNAFFRT